MKIVLVRHGETPGNREKRYVGTTDESLTEEGRRALEECRAPEVDRIYASPRRRCLETAAILYPGRPVTVVPGLAECLFGAFEYKNYRDLTGNPDYQRWIDSGGTIGFPGGESREAFQQRCLEAFRWVLQDARQAESRSAALVVHGGTIMALMSALSVPPSSYYDWQLGNGCWVEAEEQDGRLYARAFQENPHARWRGHHQP